MGEPVGLGETVRVHEQHRAQFLGAAEELLQPECGIGQIKAVHIGIDLDAAQSERTHRPIQLGHRQFGVLQRHSAQTDEAVGMLGGDLRDPVIDLRRQFGAQPRIGPVVVLGRCRRDGLDIDPHAVHRTQPGLNAG